MHLHKLGSRGEDGLIKSFLTVEWFKLACNVGVLLHSPGITHLASAAHGGTWESGPHKSHQSPLPMINSLLEGIVFLKTTSLPAQAPSNVCLEPEDWSEVLMLVWASLCRSSGATAIHCMSANLMFPPTTHQPSQSQWEQDRSSPNLSLRSSAPSVTNKRMMMGSPCDGNWELSQVCQGPVGGSGPAESCCAELPCQWDTACTTLPCHCPSREEAEELVLILLSNPFLPPCSCSVPSLRLWAIAPCSSWGWRQQGETCTLSMRGTSEAITEEK